LVIVAFVLPISSRLAYSYHLPQPDSICAPITNMKFYSIVAAALLAGLASAQSLAGLPACADNCVLDAIPSSCNLDPKCICNAKSFIAGITCCVAKACDKADQAKVITYANGICNPVGVTNLPTAAVCTGTAASSGTSTATGAAASSTGTMTITPASTAAASSVNPSQAPSSVSSAAISSVASAASSTPSAGAANGLLAQGMGVMGAVAAGAVALM